MAINKRAVKLFYDVLSPYSYFAFEILTRCNKQWDSMDLQLKPALAVGIIKATGNTAPSMIPVKAKYMHKDLPRLSEYYGIEFKVPKNLVDVLVHKGSLRAQRLLTAVAQEQPQILETVSRQVYRRIWLNDEDITEEVSLKEACLASNIKDGIAEKLVTMTNENMIKDALKNTTFEAIEYGAFGLPSYVLEQDEKPQLMFGTDRLALLAYYLGENLPGSKNIKKQC